MIRVRAGQRDEKLARSHLGETDRANVELLVITSLRILRRCTFSCCGSVASAVSLIFTCATATNRTVPLFNEAMEALQFVDAQGPWPSFCLRYSDRYRRLHWQHLCLLCAQQTAVPLMDECGNRPKEVFAAFATDATAQDRGDLTNTTTRKILKSAASSFHDIESCNEGIQLNLSSTHVSRTGAAARHELLQCVLHLWLARNDKPSGTVARRPLVGTSHVSRMVRSRVQA